ncbi:ribonuclease III domain-containing protein [Mariannaea sp. PMI_226]|nr:ribonuclease III domain-containing protein [Mariannaea sp. PMI_226]
MPPSYIIDSIALCEKIIGYSFASKVLCAEALNTAGDTRARLVFDGVYTVLPKNDRLAVYGDSAADFYLCSLWLRQKKLDKASWTKIRHDLVSNENLARVGKEHGLDGCINVNAGTNQISPAMVATTVEAILGAVEQDGGREALGKVMNQLGLAQHTLLSSEKPLE